MKHFILEEYLQNPSMKVVTRDGRNARIICTDAKTLYPIIALVESPDHVDEIARSYTKDGYFYPDKEDDCDLFFALEKHEGWVNIYKSQGRLALFTCGLRYDSEEEAIREARRNRDNTAIATVKIEWEE